MKSRIIVWIGLTVILCLASFWIGRLNRQRHGYNAVALAEDRAVLMTLRAGDSTNAIQRLEGYLDLGTYNAMLAWPSLRGRDREVLYSILLKVAHYRDQVPRPVDTSTNGLDGVQTKVDAFLHTIEELPNQSPEPTAARASGLSGDRRLAVVIVRRRLSFFR